MQSNLKNYYYRAPSGSWLRDHCYRGIYCLTSGICGIASSLASYSVTLSYFRGKTPSESFSSSRPASAPWRRFLDCRCDVNFNMAMPFPWPSLSYHQESALHDTIEEEDISSWRSGFTSTNAFFDYKYLACRSWIFWVTNSWNSVGSKVFRIYKSSLKQPDLHWQSTFLGVYASPTHQESIQGFPPYYGQEPTDHQLLVLHIKGRRPA